MVRIDCSIGTLSIFFFIGRYVAHRSWVKVTCFCWQCTLLLWSLWLFRGNFDMLPWWKFSNFFLSQRKKLKNRVCIVHLEEKACDSNYWTFIKFKHAISTKKVKLANDLIMQNFIGNQLIITHYLSELVIKNNIIFARTINGGKIKVFHDYNSIKILSRSKGYCV